MRFHCIMVCLCLLKLKMKVAHIYEIFLFQFSISSFYIHFFQLSQGCDLLNNNAANLLGVITFQVRNLGNPYVCIYYIEEPSQVAPVHIPLMDTQAWYILVD